ncbi:MAG: hypothetical protein C0483_22615 [Pirellula sp.]|nr:hypothetical protein [Pirellula sp.]
MTHEKRRWIADLDGDAEQRRQIETELAELKERAGVLERELAAMAPPSGRFTGYYTAYFATTGFMLGMFGACTSLLFNIVGVLLLPATDEPRHPLRLIQVYLTFPLGERALHIDGGLALAVGCCLYLATGMILGMFFHLFLTRYTASAGFVKRMLIVTALSLAVWLVNFYGILSWLQPLLFHGRWIVDMIPPWVAAATHLVFGWTMVLVYPWGLYVPYQAEPVKE